MSDQMKPWDRRWGGEAAVWVCAFVAAAACVGILGCGGSSGDATVAKTKPRPLAPCQLGKAVAPHVRDAPAAWTSGPHPAIALTCSGDKVDPGAAIVAYPMPGGGSCVSGYSARLDEAFGELCEPSGTRWTSQCERPGCIHSFQHTAEYTEVAGPVAPEMEGVWVAVDGKQVIEGVMLTTPHGHWLGRIGAKEPFGYFAAYIPRCVEPDQLSVHMVHADGTQAGETDRWDVAEPKCPPERAGRS